MEQRINVGIDFGTSNSAIATTLSGKVKVFEVADDKHSQPSSIFIRADGYHSTGIESINDFANPEMKGDSYHFIPSIKPGLPLEYYEGVSLKSTKRDADGVFPVKFFDIEELSNFVILSLRKNAEAQSGKLIEQVVMGRPVKFSTDIKNDRLAQTRLENAATLAGFKSVSFLMEPVAAALYYERSRPNTYAKNVFIFDFGGGTLDTCILELNSSRKLTPDNLNSQVVASHGITLGGNDLDKDVFKGRYLSYFGKDVLWGRQHLPMPSHIFNDIAEWHLIDQFRKIEMFRFLREVSVSGTDPDAIDRLITLIQDQQVFSILQHIEKGKIRLSESEKTTIEYLYKNICIEDFITEREYQRLVVNRKSEIKNCIDECLRLANLKSEQIEAVLKVGGSSSNNFVDNILNDIFKPEVESDNVFTSVVAGLSIAASEIFRESK